eukprot:snap_masked-scaffold_4-processed-gene-17.37-mRNA-1 protein AED:1.00 eAED:1.00 QI:0/0/0/0/1/1/2/0/340
MKKNDVLDTKASISKNYRERKKRFETRELERYELLQNERVLLKRQVEKLQRLQQRVEFAQANNFKLWEFSYLIRQNAVLRTKCMHTSMHSLLLRKTTKRVFEDEANFTSSAAKFSLLNKRIEFLKHCKKINKEAKAIAKSLRVPMKLQSIRVDRHLKSFLRMSYILYGIPFKEYINIAWSFLVQHSDNSYCPEGYKCSDSNVVSFDLEAEKVLYEYFARHKSLPLKALSISKLVQRDTGKIRYNCIVLHQKEKLAFISTVPVEYDDIVKTFVPLERLYCSIHQDISGDTLKIKGVGFANHKDPLDNIKNFIGWLHIISAQYNINTNMKSVSTSAQWVEKC